MLNDTSNEEVEVDVTFYIVAARDICAEEIHGQRNSFVLVNQMTNDVAGRSTCLTSEQKSESLDLSAKLDEFAIVGEVLDHSSLLHHSRRGALPLAHESVFIVSDSQKQPAGYPQWIDWRHSRCCGTS
jgi:hypothetical protein